MNKYAKLLRCITAAASVLLLLLLAWMCLDIYIQGNSAANLGADGVHISPVFTRDKVAEKLSPLLPIFIIYVILAAVTAFSGRIEGNRPELTAENRLRLMKAKLAELPAAAEAEEKKRKKLRMILYALLAVLAVPCLVYFLNASNFVSWDLEQVMAQMLVAVSPWVILAFAFVIAADFMMVKSMEREMEIIRSEGVKGPKAEACSEKKDRSGLIRILLLCAALLFIVLGIENGGLRDVLVKAVNICTECIGLG